MFPKDKPYSVSIFKRPVEIFRVLDGQIDSNEVQDFLIRTVEGREYAFCFCKNRLLSKKEDGSFYVNIYLESDCVLDTDIATRKVLNHEPTRP